MQIVITKNEQTAIINDALTSKLSYSEVSDIIIERTKRQLSEERAALGSQPEPFQLTVPEVLQLMKRSSTSVSVGNQFWDEEDYRRGERGVRISLEFSVPLDKMPKGFLENLRARKAYNDKKNQLDSLLNQLNKRRKEVKTALMESVLQSSKVGKDISTAIDELVKAARTRLSGGR